MIKNLNRRKLSRPSSHRRALLRNLATSLFKHERIKTTYSKAKEVSWFSEKLISLARRGDLASKRRLYSELADKDVRKKIYEVIVQRYENKSSGWTKIHRLKIRKSDGAEIAIVSLSQ